MVQFLRKLFIKDYNNTSDPKVRDAHGKLSCLVGIISNLFLFAFKLAFGLISGSVAIVGDSINNLSDMGSSVITLLGFKLAAMPADKEHPYGHERIEYIAGLIVSIIIMFVAFELLTNSITSIIENKQIVVSVATLVVLGLSIVFKLLQGLFYKKMGKAIDSVALEATAQDSINDSISTFVILIGSIVIYFVPSLPFALDGVLGIFVSIFIFISGIKMIKETTNPLIGVNPKSTLVTSILADIKKHNVVLGVHDIRCHMYGPTKSFMTLHVEIDAKEDILKAHDEIDNIEREIRNKYGIELTIHMDPIVTDDDFTNKIREEVTNAVHEMNLSLHDFRLVKGDSHTNLIFDIILPRKYELQEEEITKQLEEKFKGRNFYFVIDYDGDYLG